jgi:uncharacterized membrane protein YqiK
MGIEVIAAVIIGIIGAIWFISSRLQRRKR